MVGSANSLKVCERRGLFLPGGPVVRPYANTGMRRIFSPFQTMSIPMLQRTTERKGDFAAGCFYAVWYE